jgi:hypothetical protein
VTVSLLLPDDLVTLSTAADKLRCSRQRIYRWVQLGHLKPVYPCLYRWGDVTNAESITGQSPFSRRRVAA